MNRAEWVVWWDTLLAATSLTSRCQQSCCLETEGVHRTHSCSLVLTSHGVRVLVCFSSYEASKDIPGTTVTQQGAFSIYHHTGNYYFNLWIWGRHRRLIHNISKLEDHNPGWWPRVGGGWEADAWAGRHWLSSLLFWIWPEKRYHLAVLQKLGNQSEYLEFKTEAPQQLHVKKQNPRKEVLPPTCWNLLAPNYTQSRICKTQ